MCPGTHVDGGGTQEAGFANEFGVGISVGGGFAAEVPAAVAEFAAERHQTVQKILLHFLNGCLAEGFIGGSHGGLVAFVNVGVVLAGAGELIDIAFPIDGFESDPTVAIEAAVGIRPFLDEGLVVGEFFRLHSVDARYRDNPPAPGQRQVQPSTKQQLRPIGLFGATFFSPLLVWNNG